MAFNPVQALLEGQQASDQMQQREIQQRIAQQAQQQGFNPLANQDINQLQALNPQAGGDILNGFLLLDKERQRSFFTDNRKLKTLLEANNKEGALSLLGDRLKQGERIANSGGQPFNPADTLEVQQDILNNDLQGALQKSTIVDNVAIDSGFFKPAKSQQRKTATSADFDTFQGLLRKAKETGLPEDANKAEQFGRRARFIKETEQQSADIKVNAAERKEMAKFNVKRKQGFIDSGIDAADSTANIRRSLDLLKNVETGGFDNIALKLKTAFGIEGANELELSNNLGQSVLQQLKPLFGAAFTKQEGDKLDRISAKFGSSTEGNIRLLNQILKVSERAAKRGLAAAEDQGADFTAGQIRDALAFKLDDKDISTDEQPGQPQQSAPPSTSGFKILSIE